MLLFFLFKIDLVIFVETFLTLLSILVFALRVLPGFFSLEICRIYLSWYSLRIAKQLIFVPFSKTLMIINFIKSFSIFNQLLILSLINGIKGQNFEMSVFVKSGFIKGSLLILEFKLLDFLILLIFFTLFYQ